MSSYNPHVKVSTNSVVWYYKNYNASFRYSFYPALLGTLLLQFYVKFLVLFAIAKSPNLPFIKRIHRNQPSKKKIKNPFLQKLNTNRTLCSSKFASGQLRTFSTGDTAITAWTREPLAITCCLL